MVRAMRKIIASFSLMALLLVVASGEASAARGSEHGIGVGVTQTLAGISGGTFVYDAAAFHIVGLLGFETIDRAPADDTTRFALGGQFLFHVSTTAQSDFSLGAGLTFVSVDNGPDTSNVDIELLAQIRAFIVPNVALSASLGIAIINANDIAIANGQVVDGGGGTSVALGGQVVGNVGITYFF
jgi:hypothetical protein